jgi:8-oxo-dGTP pyrophosphatase MutT (NUDIX family)
MEVGAGPRGRPPGPTGKAVTAPDAASYLEHAPKAKAATVYAQLLGNYPPESIGWVKRIKWVLAEVPMTLVDFEGRGTWAASHERAKVNSFVTSLKAGQRVDPVVAIIEPGHSHIRIVDGHHRTLACEKIGWPVRAFVGYASGKNAREALEAHASQIHQGSDPENKSFTAGNLGIPGAATGLVPFGLAGAPAKRPKASVHYRKATGPGRSCGECSMFIAGGTCTDVEGPIKPGDTCDIFTPRGARKSAGPHVAGLMVRAADTGRVLMLQRALSDDDVDGAAGKWEPPGGHVEAGETLAQGALREWSEETGFAPPSLRLVGSWDSSDGVYRGFVAEIAAESVLDLEHGRGQVDNPDGDVFESVAWLDPADFADNPSIRPEMARDLDVVLAALNGVSR